ncbi:MAG: Glutathione transport system permease protein GsiC [Firmicutes bacterium]|nr:Glutathione transport system permease protein GsiC [Bacillota bacterium]
MLGYSVRRLLQGALVIFFISVAVFLLLRLVPADPIEFMVGGEGAIAITPEVVDAVRARWGLDLPLHQQYLRWVYLILRGDWGESIVRVGVPVRHMLFEAAQVTVILTVSSIALALLISIPAGVIGAVRRNSIYDYLLTFVTTLGISIPSFWFALMAIIVFALILGWLPPFGIHTWQGFILPVAVLATLEMALFTRVTRGAVIEVLDEDYIRTAYAKGLTERVVVLYHALRNALLVVVTVVGFRIAFILSGTIIVETIFAIPGIGRLFMDSIFRLDYQVVQTIVLVFAVIVVVVNLLTDLIYAYIDPRIRVR